MVNDGQSYEDVMNDLYARAKIKNMEDWLDNALNDIYTWSLTLLDFILSGDNAQTMNIRLSPEL